MKLIVLLAVVLSTVRCEQIEHHERATSYQNIHMEHFHAVPTYVKKEDHEFVKNPISLGSSSSKVEVHHGGKHDHGYAFANAENSVHGGFDAGFGLAHESVAPVEYQVQDHVGEDYAQGLGHFGFEGFGEEGQYEGHEA